VNNEKLFYRSLTKSNNANTDNGPPTTDSLYDYWADIWSNKTQLNDNALWIREEEDQLRNTNDMPHTEIMQDTAHVTKNVHEWKARGVDNLHSYWFKQLTCSHSLLAKHFNKFIKEPQNMPNFFKQGITYMKPKDSDTANPSKYRPITCLPTVYKTYSLYHIQNLHSL
jgi:hypothetical protein